MTSRLRWRSMRNRAKRGSRKHQAQAVWPLMRQPVSSPWTTGDWRSNSKSSSTTGANSWPPQPQVTEQARSADAQAEEVVQQVLGLPQGDAQVGAAVTGQQASPRADVRAREFQVATALAGLLTATAAVAVAAIAMPLNPGFGKIGHEVVFELAGRFEIPRTAMGTLLGMDVVVDKVSAWGRLRPKGAGVLSMLFATVVRTCLVAACVLIVRLRL